MKTLYLDCGMGAAGDMLAAALTELLPDPDAFIEELNALHIPDVHFIKEPAVKCGITGTHISVRVNGVEEGAETHSHHAHLHDTAHYHDHDCGHHHHEHEHTHHGDSHHHEHPHDTGTHHHHSSLHNIEHIVSGLHIKENIKKNILSVYRLIAEAESHAHGVPVSEIHFHEVGTMDAVADITAVCMLMDRISADKVIVSPVHVGSGQVRCAHGILPVPAPATAWILKDVPVYGGKINGELCTPTGAALLKTFATAFGDMPLMKIASIGYGMGKKDFEAANCVRALLGETQDQTDMMLELSCNVDDMTAEAIGFASERLFEGGAHEVYTIPIVMKKSRPGTLIRVICKEQDRENILALLFQHTTTIGVRETRTRRYVLDRKIETISTPYGDIRRKSSTGYGVRRIKYEYDDLSRIAREKHISLEDARKFAEEADRSL